MSDPDLISAQKLKEILDKVQNDINQFVDSKTFLDTLEQTREPAVMSLIQNESNITMNKLFELLNASEDIRKAILKRQFLIDFDFIYSLFEAIKELILILEGKFTDGSLNLLKDNIEFWKKLGYFYK